MSKVRMKALSQAISIAVALRRKVVDVRLARELESKLLDDTSELIGTLEEISKSIVPNDEPSPEPA